MGGQRGPRTVTEAESPATDADLSSLHPFRITAWCVMCHRDTSTQSTTCCLRTQPVSCAARPAGDRVARAWRQHVGGRKHSHTHGEKVAARWPASCITRAQRASRKELPACGQPLGDKKEALLV